MKNLFNETDLDEIINRINQLSPNSERQWGKMNVAQMLNHLNVSIGTALGQNAPKRLLIGRILGPFVKSHYLSEKPFSKNGPTDKFYIITDEKEFEKEKTKTIELVKDFHKNGAIKAQNNEHSFFGKFTPDEWSVSIWKHIDHHLRQFSA